MADLPQSMRAAVYRKPRDLVVEERPVPEPGPDDVVIQVSHCGICGTDLHLVMEGMGRPNSIGGHEYSGRIAALGANVRGWSVGDEVVGGGGAGCGRCRYCHAGRPSLCAERNAGGEFQGAFADFKRLPASELLRVPAGVGLREAALAEPLAVALHALTVSRVEPGQRVLVTGAGPLGLLVIAALRARGIDSVTVSEPSPVRRTQAERVGAATAVEPEALDAPPMPFTIVDQPFDVAFDCSGNPNAMESALAQLAPMGTLVIVGTGMRRPRFDHNRILMNELVITGAYCYDADGFGAALALLASDALPTNALIEPNDVPLDDLFSALEQLERQELAGKVMIVPRRT
jgi:(R,R)-butanediol dehydrogenase/meso-butanediol dehydrogenase/diacetyl reductase